MAYAFPVQGIGTASSVMANPTRNDLFRLLAHAALLLLLALLAAGCASTPKTAEPAHDYTTRVVDYALSLQGIPYVYGKSSPEDGFDCSGFIWHVYRRHGVKLPRTAEQMALALPEIEPEERRPGDLVLFNTGGKWYSHVGLYMGRDEFVHASSSKSGVIVSSLGKPYWRERLVGVRRPMR